MTLELFLNYNFYYADKVYPDNHIEGALWEFEMLVALIKRDRIAILYEGSNHLMDGTLYVWRRSNVLWGELAGRGRSQYNDLLVGFTADRLNRHWGKSAVADSVFLSHFCARLIHVYDNLLH